MNPSTAHPAFDSVKACIFDAYGTLFDVHSAVGRGGSALGASASSVSDTWRQKQLEYTWLRSLMGTHVDFWQITRDALEFAFDVHEIDNPDLVDNLMDLYLSLDAYPEVSKVLATLKVSGLLTGILSNGSPNMLSAAVEFSGLENRLDSVMSVEDIGVFKPDQRVYQMALDRLNLNPEQVCFVSSNTWDAHAAAYFGFVVAWINRFDKKPEKIPSPPAAEIHDLNELPPLLGLPG